MTGQFLPLASVSQAASFPCLRCLPWFPISAFGFNPRPNASHFRQTTSNAIPLPRFQQIRLPSAVGRPFFISRSQTPAWGERPQDKNPLSHACSDPSSSLGASPRRGAALLEIKIRFPTLAATLLPLAEPCPTLGRAIFFSRKVIPSSLARSPHRGPPARTTMIPGVIKNG